MAKHNSGAGIFLVSIHPEDLAEWHA